MRKYCVVMSLSPAPSSAVPYFALGNTEAKWTENYVHNLIKHLKQQNAEFNQSLTRHHSRRAVLLCVAVSKAHGAGIGFSLVHAQRLPLLLQTVLILQVILHVRLKNKTKRGLSICSSKKDLQMRLVWVQFGVKLVHV